MTQDSLRFRIGRLANWAPCLAFVLLGAAPLLLTGCSDTTAPAAADEQKNVATAIEMPRVTTDATLAVTAPRYGRWLVGGMEEQIILPVDYGQSVQFQWRATSSGPAAGSVAYRYGWNVQDPDDPLDAGWFGPPRGGYKAQQTQPRQFWDGSQFLTIECWDGDTLLVRVVYEVWVPPVSP